VVGERGPACQEPLAFTSSLLTQGTLDTSNVDCFIHEPGRLWTFDPPSALASEIYWGSRPGWPAEIP
jgi:hypothetical protein